MISSMLMHHLDHTPSDGWRKYRQHMTKEEAELYLSPDHRVRCIK